MAGGDPPHRGRACSAASCRSSARSCTAPRPRYARARAGQALKNPANARRRQNRERQPNQDRKPCRRADGSKRRSDLVPDGIQDAVQPERAVEGDGAGGQERDAVAPSGGHTPATASAIGTTPGNSARSGRARLRRARGRRRCGFGAEVIGRDGAELADRFDPVDLRAPAATRDTPAPAAARAQPRRPPRRAVRHTSHRRPPMATSTPANTAAYSVRKRP